MGTPENFEAEVIEKLLAAGEKGATLAKVRAGAKAGAALREAALLRLLEVGLAVRGGTVKSPKFIHREHYQALVPEDFKGALIFALEEAKELGCKKTALVKKSAERLAALQELLAAGAVVDIGTAKAPRYVLPLYHRPLEMAYESVEAKATPGLGQLFSRAALAKGLAGAVAAKVDEAIDLLVLERKLIPLKQGASVVYVHYASLQGLLPVGLSGTEAGNAVAQAEAVAHSGLEATAGAGAEAAEADFKSLRQAYQQLVAQPPGYLDVLIYDLQRVSSLSLEAVKQTLIAGSRAGQVVPTLGDFSLSSPEVRAAGLEIGGDVYLRVRFL